MSKEFAQVYFAQFPPNGFKISSRCTCTSQKENLIDCAWITGDSFTVIRLKLKSANKCCLHKKITADMLLKQLSMKTRLQNFGLEKCLKKNR